MAATIEGYASVTSAAAGDVVDIHVRAATAYRHFTMEVYRRGSSDELVQTVEADAFVPDAQDDAALATGGCGWPAAAGCRMVIPDAWRSGYYVAKLSALDQSAWIPFFVRSAAPGTTSPILLKWSDTTAQAYTAWGGRSLYTIPHAPKISFDRPYNDMSLFERYQLPFLRWAETVGVELDYCSSLDLHNRPRLLEPYRLLISLGHDEYWSLEMRDQVEAFIASGGNVAFLSANTCFWQARFDFTEGRRIMICYKETENYPPDPERSDPRRVTVQWSAAPVSRPENRMTGVSYRNGAGWWNDPILPERRFRGYTVTNAGHWAFAGTNLTNGDVFGDGTSVDDAILGYETDAAIIQPGSNPPVVTGSDGTPRDFDVLASADLKDWAAGGQGGAATMGFYQRNGLVFTAGTVNWVGGFSDDANSSAVDQITRNLVVEMSRKRAGTFALPNAGFEDWSNGVPVGWVLDGAGAIGAEPSAEDVTKNQMRFSDAGRFGLKIDASRGETWTSRSGLSLTGTKTYGAGCWIQSQEPGATIRLQTTDTWVDFATAEHSGSGEWEYVFAVGSIARNETNVAARVKLQVASGSHAVFDGVSIVEIGDRSA